MSGIDNRIVTMKFDNRSFEQNAQTSLSTLQKLKAAMNFGGAFVGGTVRALGMIESALSRIGLKTPFAPMIRAANTGLAGVGTVLDKLGMRNPFESASRGAQQLGVSAAEANQSMGRLEGGVTAVSAKFVALTTIAVTALQNITNRAINAGTAWAKSFSVGPIMDGLHEYETNLKAIQTTQANTDRPLTEINRSLDELNAYSDQTIYNFGEMAKNVGTFTAAGVDLQTSVSSIKGIANLAALSGSSSEQAATAMYQLSQAIAAGKVGLQDWNSVVNAGMGGKKLQNALAQTAIAMGEIDKTAVKMEGPMKKLTIRGQSFRESIMANPGQESWLTSDILVNTLAVMDGRFSVAAQKAELAADGTRKYTDAQIKANIATARTNLETKNGVKFTDEQFAALQKMSTAAFKAATEVKTLGQVFDIAKETIGSGWSASFRNIFGDLKQAKTLFTGMSNGLNDILKKNALARNNLLSAWSKKNIGGRDTLIDGLKNAWEAFIKIGGSVRDAFRDIFPRKTVKDLQMMTVGFTLFTQKLIPSEKTMKSVRDIFRGVFAVFSIGKQILGGIITGFKTLFGAVGGGNGNFLEFLATIGNMLTSFDAFLKKSGIITSFFTSLGGLLSIPLSILQGIAHIFTTLFSNFKTNKATGEIDKVTSNFDGLLSVSDAISGFFNKLGSMFDKFGDKVGEAFSGLGGKIAKFLTSDSFGPALDAINTGLFATLTVAITKFLKGGLKVDVGKGLFSGLADSIGEVTDTLVAVQTNLKANALLKIGIAIGVLALSLSLLSTIPPGKLSKALTAMSVGMGLLVVGLVALMKYMGPASIVQMWAVTSALQRMSFAILLMSFALKTLAGIKFGDMVRGLAGLAGVMLIMSKFMPKLAAGSKGMARASLAIIGMAIALNLMAIAMKIFATMSWEEIGRGLVGLVGSLTAVAIAMRLMPDISAEAVTLIALGVAINLLAVAMKIFATMSWEDLGKGMTGLVGALVGIAAAMRLMPKKMILQAVALNAIASAIVILSGALALMGQMSWEQIGKGLATLGGSLLILAVGLKLMKGSLAGAAALVVATAAIAVLVPVIAALGALPLTTIFTALGALAGVFVVLGVAGYLLAPVAPIIVALAGAIMLLGAGVALAGVGILAIGTGIALVIGALTASAAVLSGVLQDLIAAIPPAMVAFGQGIVGMVTAIGQGAPAIAKAFGDILRNLLDTVIDTAPKMGQTFLVLLNTALRVIVQAVPRIANAGLQLLIGFLGAIGKNIGKVIDKATDVIVGFMDGLARNMDRIIDSGVRLVIAFVRGVAKGVREHSRELGEAGGDLAVALVEGLVQGIQGGAGRIKDAALDAAKGAFNAAKDFFGVGSPLMRDYVGKPISRGMAIGIREGAPEAVEEMGILGRTLVSKVSDTMSQVNDAFAIDANLNPTVTPVLDLSQMTREANRMSRILTTAPIMPTVSYNAAADIATVTQAPSQPSDGPDEPGAINGGGSGDTINYIQNITAPHAIDSVTVYRGSKTLLAMKKEELAK